MAFTIFSASNASAPTLNGTVGSFLALMDACLVNGYGTKSAVGWSKPFPNTSSYGVITQGAGSAGCSLFIYDNGSGSAGGAEASITGWDTITSIEGGWATGSNQFPTFAQLAVRTGSVIVRKSAAQTATARDWRLYADSRTVYGFIASGDSAGTWTAFMFGDFFSIKSGSIDTNRCIIIGRISPSSSTLGGVDRLDAFSTLNGPTSGHFVSRTYTGLGGSITVGKHGDAIKGSASNLNGIVPYPNPVDSGSYVSPIWVHEGTNNIIRGRMRGFWHGLHTAASYTDAQIISSSNDFPGIQLQVIRTAPSNGVYLMEISNTLETN
jgi:hypothetical protein